VDLARLRGLHRDGPTGVLAHEGRLPSRLDGAYARWRRLTGWAASERAGLQTDLRAHRAWHEAGGNAVQELGFGLATALEYVRAMNARGVEVDFEVVAPAASVRLHGRGQFFTEIAKLRAARMLWARLASVLGRIAGESQRSLAPRPDLPLQQDGLRSHVNMLRTTVEAFAGVLGRMRFSLQVGAFDEVVRTPGRVLPAHGPQPAAGAPRGMPVHPGHRIPPGARGTSRHLTAELAGARLGGVSGESKSAAAWPRP
jgi:methylmalonyl-CoA mutase